MIECSGAGFWVLVLEVVGSRGQFSGARRSVTVVVDVQVGVVGLECGDLGAVADLDVGVVGILEGVVLVVVLGAVEGFERDDLRDDAVLPGVGGVELRDVGLGDALLVVVGVEDGGAVGGAGVRALAVERGGVVDGEEDAEELAVGEARGIVDDLDGFGVVGGLGGDVVVVRGAGGAAGVAGGGGDDALDALEDGLCAPETSAGEDGGGAGGRCGEREVGGWRSDGAVFDRLRVASDGGRARE